MIDEKNVILSLDIGTSSVKAMMLNQNGVICKSKETYAEISIDGWKRAIKSVISKMSLRDVIAITFSSQVGTYIIDDKDVVSWNCSGGDEYLRQIKLKISQVEFEKEISMPHPDIVSYPLPRLLGIREKYPQAKKACMPKDYFIEELTGNYVTDAYSWRGLVNLETNKYSESLLERFGLKFDLPQIVSCNEIGGFVTKQAAKEYGLPVGIPVVVGANDFYCGLLGMGVTAIGDTFDLSGTSEHVGVITKNINRSSPVSGPYFIGNASYGGTKASGVACDFAIREFDVNGLSLNILENSPPIFLPYLTGERSPIFDENARGVFFGLNDKTDKKSLAYSVFEGMVFGVYDAGLASGIRLDGIMVGAGGSFVNDFVTKLKAEVFGKEIVLPEENDVSALGAGIIGLNGMGVFKTVQEAANKLVVYKKRIKPCGKYADLLKKRFEIYKSLYKNLKEDFKKFNVINGGKK